MGWGERERERVPNIYPVLLMPLAYNAKEERKDHIVRPVTLCAFARFVHINFTIVAL